MIAQGTAEWKAQRVGIVTCSKIGAVLGLDPYCKPKHYFEELIGLREPFAGNAFTEWGSEHEPIAVSDYEAEEGVICLPSGFIKHPTIEWLGGSPDPSPNEYLVEFKCPARFNIPAEPPPKYVAQVRGLLEVTGKPYGILRYWTPGGSFSYPPIERDREKWAAWYPKLEKFWSMVQSKEWKK